MASWKTVAVYLTLTAALPALAVECPEGRPPPTAQGATPLQTELTTRVTSALKFRTGVGQSPGTQYCLTRSAIFFDPAWLPAASLEGPTPAALAPLAWLAGLQRALFHLPKDAGPPERIASTQAGCALARLGIRGDTLETHRALLESLTTAPQDREAHRISFVEGYRRCARN